MVTKLKEEFSELPMVKINGIEDVMIIIPPIGERFALPYRDILLALKKGDLVQLMFYREGQLCERMWVEIIEKTSYYFWTGKLKSKPLSDYRKFKKGRIFKFPPSLVINIVKRNERVARGGMNKKDLGNCWFCGEKYGKGLYVVNLISHGQINLPKKEGFFIPFHIGHPRGTVPALVVPKNSPSKRDGFDLEFFTCSEKCGKILEKALRRHLAGIKCRNKNRPGTMQLVYTIDFVDTNPNANKN